jgi:hypothetical protein
VTPSHSGAHSLVWERAIRDERALEPPALTRIPVTTRNHRASARTGPQDLRGPLVPLHAARLRLPRLRRAALLDAPPRYDTGRLELLPHLEPCWRAEVAHAVMHPGLIGAYRRFGRPWAR